MNAHLPYCLQEMKGTVSVSCQNILLVHSDASYPITLCTNAAPAYLLFTNYNYIRRINPDGSGSSSVRYNAYVYGVDFDFRQVSEGRCGTIYRSCSLICFSLLETFLKCTFLFHRRNYMFWLDLSGDKIWRAALDGSGSATLLISTDLCVPRE